MRQMKIVPFIIVLLIILIGAYLLFTNPNLINQLTSPVDTQPEITSTPPAITQTPLSPTTQNGQVEPAPTVPANWKTYNATGFTFNYPPDVQLRETPEGAVFTKIGPTQTQGTEIFDGFMVSFDSGSLAGQSLQQFVNSRHSQAEQEPTTQQISLIEPVTIANLSGYQYTVTSLGEFDYIYLPRNRSDYIEIIKLVEDPTNQGFESTVGQMLSSIQITE